MSSTNVQILFFSATWCNPCKAVKPVIEKMCSEKGYDLQIFDAEEHQNEFEFYSVRGVPTVLVVKDHTELYRDSSATGIQKIPSLMEDILND